MEVIGRTKHDYMDIGGRVTQEQLPRMLEPRATHDYRDIGGTITWK